VAKEIFNTREMFEAYSRITLTKWLSMPTLGHDHGYYINTRAHFERALCHKNTSVTSGTLFLATKLPLTKWLWAVYWDASDKGGISALRLSKLIGVNWRSAYLLLKKLRNPM
jgi:hypothetical protein